MQHQQHTLAFIQQHCASTWCFEGNCHKIQQRCLGLYWEGQWAWWQQSGTSNCSCEFCSIPQTDHQLNSLKDAKDYSVQGHWQSQTTTKPHHWTAQHWGACF